MKIVSIYGGVTGFDCGLNIISKIISDTFTELGETVEEINLNHQDIPFYDGICSSSVQKISAEIKASSGIIFSFVSNISSPCSIMQSFLEHLMDKSIVNSLKDKNIFLVTSSPNSGEEDALNYVGKLLKSAGAYDAVRLGISMDIINNLDADLRKNIERYVEDYYRIARQNRQFIFPSDYSPNTAQINQLNDEDYKKLMGYDRSKTATYSDLEKKYNFDSFTKKQEDDIEEITKFFSTKYKESSNIIDNSSISPPLILSTPAPAPREKTARQMTQSLVHYFKPQIAAGLTATIQINITGSEEFSCYLQIVNTECDYFDGTAQSADLTIICDTSIWIDILKGKYSTQKAFMIGHLKVRGNFVLLTKFDQIFNGAITPR